MVSSSYLLIFVLGVLSTVSGMAQRGAERAIGSSSAKSKDARQRLLDLVNDPPVGQLSFNLIDLPIVREFFKDKELVGQLVSCFDITQTCPKPGLTLLIQDLADSFQPGLGCPSCPANFNKVVTFAQNQFRKNYKDEWFKLVQLIPDHIG